MENVDEKELFEESFLDFIQIQIFSPNKIWSNKWYCPSVFLVNFEHGSHIAVGEVF